MRRRRILLELFIQGVIFYSLVTYFIEMEFGRTEHSLEGHPIFLWSERAVAGIFTVEYFARWLLAERKLFYPLTPLALIDLMAVLPFYLGFLVDLRTLRLVRTLRVLRAFKLYRYNEALQSFVQSYGKIKNEIHVLAVAVLLVVFFSATIVYEAEHETQPEMFAKYSDSLWWSVVTLTTVGYGDKYPVTATGRLAAAVTLVIGLGLFGSFISLLGSAFVSTLNEKKQAQEIHLSPANRQRIAEMLAQTGTPVTEENVNRAVAQALEALQEDVRE